MSERTDEASNHKDSAEEEANNSQIPIVTDANNIATNVNEVYFQEVDRIDNFSATESALLDKYGSCVPTDGTIPGCNTNPLYQPYHCPPTYPYQQDAQVYSHYDQYAPYDQNQNTAFNDQQTSQEHENTINSNEHRNYTSPSTESQNDSRHSSVKTEPENSSPIPPVSASNWSSYVPLSNMDMPEYNQYHQYDDYNKEGTRAYNESVLNVPETSMGDPMLSGPDMGNLSTTYNMATTTAPAYSSAVKYERDSLAHASAYTGQYQKGMINASETDVKPKKSVRVPAGKLILDGFHIVSITALLFILDDFIK